MFGINAKIAAKKISQKYKNIRAKRKRVESPEPIIAEIKMPKLFLETRNKSAIIAAKKVSDKYKKIRKSKNIELVSDIQQTKSNKNAFTAAKKIMNKHRNLRGKRAPIPFNLADLADAESVVYKNDTNLQDVSSTKSAKIAAKNISNKYKKMRAKEELFPFNLSDIPDTETIDYNDDTNLQDVNMDKNAILTAKKISEKYRNIRKKKGEKKVQN